MGEYAIGAGPVVMGVLNVTPDSFSDGGRYLDPAAAVRHGLALRAAGADLVDVGGESTRPGADRVDPATERGRVLPVVGELAAAGVPVSIDTTRAEVAAGALAAGAVVVNDVSGGTADPELPAVVAGAGCPYVIMHGRGPSREMVARAGYRDVVAEVVSELGQRVAVVRAAGVAADRIIVDPGLGFAKTAAHNWELGRRLAEVRALGYPVLVGPSRKRYLGALLAGPDGAARPEGERDPASVAAALLAVAAGAWGVRVHDVRATADALAVWHASGRPCLSSAEPGTTQPTPGEPAAGDRVRVTGLRAYGRHGVYDWERERGQEFVVDAELELDLAPAAATDALPDTVDYDALASRLAAVVTGEPVRLLETLATRLAESCLADPRVAAATVTVHKPQARLAADIAGVAVTRRLRR